MLAAKKILLTGGNGFVGSHVLELLVEKGFCPVVLLRPNSDLWRISHLGDKFKTFKYSNVDDLASVMEMHEIDTIIHIATEYGRYAPLSSILQTNVIFPLQLIEAGAKHSLELFINTDTFFGKEHFTLNYLNNYTTSKRILESLLRGLANKIGIANVRLEHVYGENDGQQKFVTNILTQALQNKDKIALSAGLQKRDFIYVKDVASAYLHVVHHYRQTGFKEFEVGTGKSISVKAFVNKIAELTQSKSILDFGAIDTQTGEIEDSKADTTSLKKLGWHLTYNLDDALKTVILNEKKKLTHEIRF